MSCTIWLYNFGVSRLSAEQSCAMAAAVALEAAMTDMDLGYWNIAQDLGRTAEEEDVELRSFDVLVACWNFHVRVHADYLSGQMR